jgi:hypothetical protein
LVEPGQPAAQCPRRNPLVKTKFKSNSQFVQYAA